VIQEETENEEREKKSYEIKHTREVHKCGVENRKRKKRRAGISKENCSKNKKDHKKKKLIGCRPQ
jgi:hypothetical protein